MNEPQRDASIDEEVPSTAPVRPWGEMAVVADPDEDLPETIREPRPDDDEK